MMSAPASRRTPFVICADDYGMTAEVSAGILELARCGHISATSVMTLSPHWPASAPPLKEVAGRLDIGLHLDWTSHFAVRQGFGHALPVVMLLSLARVLRPAEVEYQIQAQLDLFEQHFQAAPDHVDGHQHIHQFPVIRDALIHVLERRYEASQRPWLRISRVSKKDDGGLKSRIINAMGAHALQALAEQHGFAHSRYLTGIYDFQGDAELYRQHCRTWIEQIPEGTVMMCHPARAASAEAPFPDARLWEQEILEDFGFPQWIHDLHAVLVRGSDLFKAAPKAPNLESVS